jgi:selenide,water dikinase
LLVGFDLSDDACVYRLSDELVLIQTVDFFPPVVDDPYSYGQIAAANALSDIYAMGAEPRLALNLLCFPACLSMETLRGIMEGGQSKVAEAGAVIAGGHSIDDPEPKYGLCVTGLAHPARIWSNAGAKAGDILILTKPLGSGITVTGAKGGLLTPEQFAPSVEAMASLNKHARDAAAHGTVNGCTDITGFGLAGHARELADASGVTLVIEAKALPLLPYAEKLAKDGIIPGGAYRNREYLKDALSVGEGVPAYLEDIVFDPQTSGGLLLSVPESEAERLLSRMEKNTPAARIIGRVKARGDFAAELV